MQENALKPTHSSLMNATHLAAFNHTAIQPVLALLGWKDIRQDMYMAANADQALGQDLHDAYEAYQAVPHEVSKAHLNRVLDTVIKKLDADIRKATQLAQDAATRFRRKKTTRNMGSYVWQWMSSMKEGLQSLFDSDDTALFERYNMLAET